MPHGCHSWLGVGKLHTRCHWWADGAPSLSYPRTNFCCKRGWSNHVDVPEKFKVGEIIRVIVYFADNGLESLYSLLLEPSEAFFGRDPCYTIEPDWAGNERRVTRGK
eukprot:13520309-Heterocapsa_arctica.AAC.1